MDFETDKQHFSLRRIIQGFAEKEIELEAVTSSPLEPRLGNEDG
jgi:hypothetical protein